MSKAKAKSAAEALRPTEGSTTLSSGGKSVTLHADGRTETTGLSGKATSIAEAAVEVVGGKPIVMQEAPELSRVEVPTRMKDLCAGESPYEAVTIVREEAGGCLLIALDGRGMAVTPSVFEDVDGQAVADRIPAVFAIPTKDGARTLRCSSGFATTLFGDVNVWIDAESGRFEPVPQDAKLPKLSDVMPDITDRDWYYFTIDAARLLAIAQAVNTGDAPEGVNVITVAVKRREDGKSGSVAVIGDRGAGVLVSHGASRELDSKRYMRVRERAKKAGV